MSDKAEACDISHGTDSVLFLANQLRGLFIQCSHRLNGTIDPRWFGLAILDRSRNHSGAQRLRQHQSVTSLGTAIGKNFLWMNQAGDGVSKLGFVVANAMAANHRSSCLDHLREAAGTDALKNFQVGFLREADQP